MSDLEVQNQIERETLDQRSRYDVTLLCAGTLFVLTLWVVTHAYLSIAVR
jgi:hypothetical protein